MEFAPAKLDSRFVVQVSESDPRRTSVLCLKSEPVPYPAPAPPAVIDTAAPLAGAGAGVAASPSPKPTAAAAKGRDKDRVNKESGPRIAAGTKIGGELKVQANPSFLADRSAVFNRVKAAQEARLAGQFSAQCDVRAWVCVASALVR